MPNYFPDLIKKDSLKATKKLPAQGIQVFKLLNFFCVTAVHIYIVRKQMAS